jgi:hypothetical protein
MFNKFKIILLNTCALALVFGGVILAGNISNPGGEPNANSAPYTLEDVYQKLTNQSYSYSEHSLSPTVSTSTPTMHSVEEIYNITPTRIELDNSTTTMVAGIYGTTTLSDIETNLTQENIANGVSIFGVSGNLECTAP